MRIVATVYYSDNGWVIDLPTDMLPNDQPRTYISNDKDWVLGALDARLTLLSALSGPASVQESQGDKQA